MWAVHVVGMEHHHIPKKVLGTCFGGGRPVGRPWNRWEVTIQWYVADLLLIRNWKAVARDKEEWRKKFGEAMARKWAEAPKKKKKEYDKKHWCSALQQLSHMWDFKFSRRRVWCSELSSGLYCRVKWLSTIILHGSTSQKTILNIILYLCSELSSKKILNIILAAVRSWNLTYFTYDYFLQEVWKY
jgi:hypothetical protein